MKHEIKYDDDSLEFDSSNNMENGRYNYKYSNISGYDDIDNTDPSLSIYGKSLPEMEDTMAEIVDIINVYRKERRDEVGEDPVEHLAFRIKADESMRQKCRMRDLPENTDSALYKLFDAIGIRVVCAFRSDVYKIKNFIASRDDFEVIEEKDYIKHSKENGYRSYHMIIRYNGFFAEIQIRTISMDTWAALEHQMRYKKRVEGNSSLIASELKRCADELASTDISMQTLRDMICGIENKEE